MELSKVADYLRRLSDLQTPISGGTPIEVVIKVFEPGKIGPQACVPVAGISPGIDWDKGKVLIETAMPVTLLTQEQVAAIMKSVREGSSWHAYQRYKVLKERMDALESCVKAFSKAVGETQFPKEMDRASLDAAVAMGERVLKEKVA